MDQITASIVGALMAGVLSGFTEMSKSAVTDAYTKLKGLLSKKFGASSGVTQAIAQLESKPDSPHRQGVLQEELTRVNAWQDTEVMRAASHLHMLVNKQQQTINIDRATVGGSISQVGRDQYQAGRDQINVYGPELIGYTSQERRIGYTALTVFVGFWGGIALFIGAGFLATYVGIQNWWPPATPKGVMPLIISCICFIIGILIIVGAVRIGRSIKKI